MLLATGGRRFVGMRAARRGPEEIARGSGSARCDRSAGSATGAASEFCLRQRGEAFSLDAAEVDLLTTFGTLIAGFSSGRRARRAASPEELRASSPHSRFARAAHAVAAIYVRFGPLGRARGGALAGTGRPSCAGWLSQQVEAALRAGREPPRPLTPRGRLDSHLPHRDRVRERLAEIVDAVSDGHREVRFEVPAGLRAVVEFQASIASSRTCSRTPCGMGRRPSSSPPPGRTASSRHDRRSR